MLTTGMSSGSSSVSTSCSEAASRAALLIALSCGALCGCVDSSIPDLGDNPASPGSMSLSPAGWNTHPAKVRSFHAFDPIAPSAPVVWTVPGALKVLSLSANDLSVLSGPTLGSFELGVRSTLDPDVTGEADVKVVDFGFSFKLAQGFAGNASQQPFGDVAVSRAMSSGSGAPGRIFVAYHDAATLESSVRTFDPDFETEVLAPVTSLAFHPLQPPRITADAQGNAYWIEQFFRHPVRHRRVSQLALDGTLSTFDHDPALFGGLELCLGTDIASNDQGDLYVMATLGGQCLLCRLEGVFSPAPQATILGPILGSALDVELAVDSQGRLLVAIVDQLFRWTPLPGGNASIEFLADLPGDASDIEADAEGVLYATLEQELIVLDLLGDPAASITTFQLPGGIPAGFQQLLGLGVDTQGNLRLLDDPLSDDPNLGVFAALKYAVDVGPLPE